MSDDREAVTNGPWSDRYTYVPALRVGNTVWLSGTTGTGDETSSNRRGGFSENSRRC